MRCALQKFVVEIDSCCSAWVLRYGRLKPAQGFGSSGDCCDSKQMLGGAELHALNSAEMCFPMTVGAQG